MNQFEIEYVYTEGAETIIQKYYRNINKINFFNFKYCSNNNLMDEHTVCLWKIKLKNSQTNYNPEDLTPLPEGFTDTLP